jgi:sulfite exporter TauE/SafE
MHEILNTLNAIPYLGAILWGILHGLTPHGHSWLVLLPFALGGINARGMLRLAVAYGLGMVVVAAATGAVLGTLARAVPEAWHQGVEVGVGVMLAVMGIAFIARPDSVHHTMDHICGEHCHSTGEQKLLRSGTMAGLFLMGILSMLIPCPTNYWLYGQSFVSRSPLDGALLFIAYAISTSVTVGVVAVLMTTSRNRLAPLEQRSNRLLTFRLSGVVVLLAGAWMLWLGFHPHDHQHHDEDEHEHGARPAVVWQVAAR